MPMGLQVPLSLVRIAIREADLLAESLMVSDALSHHNESVGLYGVSTYHATGLSRYNDQLSHVGAQTNGITFYHVHYLQALK